MWRYIHLYYIYIYIYTYIYMINCSYKKASQNENKPYLFLHVSQRLFHVEHSGTFWLSSKQCTASRPRLSPTSPLPHPGQRRGLLDDQQFVCFFKCLSFNAGRTYIWLFTMATAAHQGLFAELRSISGLLIVS